VPVAGYKPAISPPFTAERPYVIGRTSMEPNT
jgi:hypothetical protein